MKAADLKKKCTEMVAQLIAAVKTEMNDSKILEYLEFCSRFHNYSFHNRLLIWMHRPNATLVAGFKTWAKMGRYVKKSEKGIPILAPMTIKVRKEQDEREDQDMDDILEQDHQPEVITRFKVVYVFDVSQTDGDPLPEAPDITAVSGDASRLLPALERIVQSQGIGLSYVESLPRDTLGISKKGRIDILVSLDTAQRFSVLVHEFAHELLHGSWERANLLKKVKELEAEATAYVVLKHFGLKGKAPQYLALYRVEEVDIMASLDRIVSTASRIIGGLEQFHSEPEQKKAA